MPASKIATLPVTALASVAGPAAAGAAARRSVADAGARLARMLEIEQYLLRAGWGENGCASWDPAGTPAAAVPSPLLPRPYGG